MEMVPESGILFISACLERFMRRKTTKSRNEQPMVLGTGLIALDVVVNETRQDTPRLWAGGTCGNVLAILSYLGWRSVPVGRLAEDSASVYIKQDLASWNVHLDLLSLEPRARAPIIFQHLTETASGIPFHRFSWTCPACGKWLPPYRAVIASSASAALPDLSRSQVFFFDRVSRAALTLAKHCFDKGALIVFEPSCSQDPQLFREALALTHILKYSHERSRKLQPLLAKARHFPSLEIETLGAEGLRFRSHIQGHNLKNWQRLSAYELKDFRDPSGAGDWCTAGIIHRLGRQGAAAFKRVTLSQLQGTFAFAQALAAWTCRYEGARGGMYFTDREMLFKEVEWIMKGKPHNTLPGRGTPSEQIRKVFEGLCTGCKGQARKSNRTVTDTMNSTTLNKPPHSQ
jgi:sugar/nucleoside kinase (ribokinase family)